MKTISKIWLIFAVQIVPSQGSIAGVTYREHFDFETRYRNIHECDPLYYHPLHLPEECTQMYEKVIRANLNPKPYQIVTTNRRYLKELPRKRKRNRICKDEHDTEEYVEYPNQSDEYVDEVKQENPIFSPYSKLLESLTIDVKHQPAKPQVVMSNIGPIAVYQQPISKYSEKLIKRLTDKKEKNKPNKVGPNTNEKPKKQSLKKLIKAALKDDTGEGYNLLIYDHAMPEKENDKETKKTSHSQHILKIPSDIFS